MISDEPDEDADTLDDDVAIETLLGDALAKPDRPAASAELPDWPPRSALDIGLSLDAETLAWFKETHADWRRQIRSVLRAWMVANTAIPQPRAVVLPAGNQP
jgi:uncharacterized protein (DUF4415 family)